MRSQGLTSLDSFKAPPRRRIDHARHRWGAFRGQERHADSSDGMEQDVLQTLPESPHSAGLSPLSSTSQPAAQKGDVVSASRSGSRSGSRRQRRHGRSTRSTTGGSTMLSPQVGNLDPFADWKRSALDLNRMSLQQFKLQSEVGMGELHEDIKIRNRLFKCVEMKDYDDDRLFENRTLYSDHGFKVFRKGLAKRDSRWAQALPDAEKSSKSGSQKSSNKSSSLPDLKSLSRQMKDSFARFPSEQERMRKEENARRKEEAEL